MKVSSGGHQKVMTEITTNSVRKEMSVTAPGTQTGNPSRTSRTPVDIYLPGSSSANSWQKMAVLPLEYGQSDTPKRLQIGPPIPPVASLPCPLVPLFLPFTPVLPGGIFLGRAVSAAYQLAERLVRKGECIFVLASGGYSLCVGFLFSP